jgi:ribosomal RNA-processing protein 7
VDDLPNGRTLFVAGLPVDAEESDLRAVFSEYGAVETVLFKVAEQGHASDPWAKAGDDDDEDEDDDDDDDDEEDAMDDEEDEEAQAVAPSEAATSRRGRRKLRKPPPPPQVIPLPSLDPRSQPFLPSCSSCYLVYLDGLSLQRAVALAPTRPPTVISRSQASPSGLSYYLQQHRLLRPSLATIKQHADTSMALFDHHQAIEQARTSKPITDEDGFTLVVRSGRSGRTAGKGDKGVAVASRRFVMESKKLKGVEGAVLDAREGLQRGKPKKKKTQFEGFYRFQRQEQKRQGEFPTEQLRRLVDERLLILDSIR